MAAYLDTVIEDDTIECGVCEKTFEVSGMTLDDWNFTWDQDIKSDCCNSCVNQNRIPCQDVYL